MLLVSKDKNSPAGKFRSFVLLLGAIRGFYDLTTMEIDGSHTQTVTLSGELFKIS